jgi:hypothetical protein
MHWYNASRLVADASFLYDALMIRITQSRVSSLVRGWGRLSGGSAKLSIWEARDAANADVLDAHGADWQRRHDDQ